MKLIMTIILSAVGIVAGRFIYHKFFAETPCNPPAGMECASLEHLRHVGREVSAELRPMPPCVSAAVSDT